MRLVVICLVFVALGSPAWSRTVSAEPLRVHALKGSVVRLGTSRGGHDLFGVRLTATVCVGSAQKAKKTFPTEIGITHYAVIGKRWWPARAVIDRAPWFVSLGELWKPGLACGPLVVEDPIPREHYSADSLGDRASCYGARLTIKVERIAGNVRETQRASKRTLVVCGPRFGAR